MAVLEVTFAWERYKREFARPNPRDQSPQGTALYNALEDLLLVIDQEAARKRIAELAGQFLDDQPL